MTVNNDRDYFKNNPQYHMFLHPEYPSYDDQINAREPRSSKLLTKSISIHGRDMIQAPLNGRDAVAFRTLEQWVNRTVDSNPQLTERSVIGSSAVAPLSGDASASPKSGERWGADRAVDPRPKTPPASANTTPPPSPAPMKPVTTPLAPTVSEPDDVERFNRGEFHAPPKPGAGQSPGA